jgi:hypothetical protein
MNDEAGAHRFSVAAIPEMRNRLSTTQKALFDQLWNHFARTGEAFPVRSLPMIIEKQRRVDAFEGLNGSLLFESQEGNDLRIRVTMHGALLSEHGNVLASLLLGLLGALKRAYEANKLIEGLDSTLICAGRSEQDSTLLLSLLKLGLPPGQPLPAMPFWLGRHGGSATWEISVTREIVDLYQFDDLLGYLNERLSAGYDPREPYEYEARNKRSLERLFAPQREAGTEHMKAGSAVDDIGAASSKLLDRDMAQETDADRAGLPEDVRKALVAACRDRMPPSAAALYARWWQLETWLRSLVYVELRAAYGPQWANRLPQLSEKRRLGDEQFRYMATSDNQARLAYTDVTDLFKIIEADWTFFEDTLLKNEVWVGRTVELGNIRNRIGHCRRPHVDDLSRLEQTLRDLEGGTIRAAAAFNRQSQVPKEWKDPLIEAWVGGQHPTAQRLIEHAERQHKTSFSLRCSRRPWVARAPATPPISGTRGYLWHANWYMLDRGLNLRRFWESNAIDPWREAVLLVCATDSRSLKISFSALEDSGSVADAIGDMFDLVLGNQTSDLALVEFNRWNELNADLDPRVQTCSMWSIVDDETQPICIFGA